MANRESFLANLYAAAQETGQRTGVDPRIILAQAALESNWGRSAPGNNLFGIKSHGVAGGNTLSTTEVVNGRPVRIQDSFRAYADPADSVRGYGEFITQNPRYAAFRSAQGLDAQVAELGKSGYATDPNYASKISSIARSLPIDGSALPAAPGKSFGEAVAAPPTATPARASVGQPLAPMVATAADAPFAPPASPQSALASLFLQNQQAAQQRKQDDRAAEEQRRAALFAGIDPFSA